MNTIRHDDISSCFDCVFVFKKVKDSLAALVAMKEGPARTLRTPAKAKPLVAL